MANLFRIFGRRELLQEDELRSWMSGQRSVDEPLDEADCKIIFETSLQRTWLVRTTRNLYNVLDDVRKPQPHLSWFIPMAEIVDERGFHLPISVKERKDQSPRTGLVDFGPKHRNWLYSKAILGGDAGADLRHFIAGTVTGSGEGKSRGG